MTRPDDPMFTHVHPFYLELSESLPVSHGRPTLATLKELRDRGVRLVVDQFGGGLSNLKYIADLEPAVVKLDPSFNRALLQSEAHRKLVGGIVRLVQDLGAAVAAVAVGSLRELDALASVGVSYVEGDFVGRPSVSPVIDPSVPSWPSTPSRD